MTENAANCGPIIGLGVDIVELPRIRAVYERHPTRFVHRIYTADERKRLETLRDPVPYLAGRWAVKEAVLKVLGTGLTGGISWRDINVIRLPSGAPSVALGGAAAARRDAIGLGAILVTISHGRDHAVAVAVGLASHNGAGGRT